MDRDEILKGNIYKVLIATALPVFLGMLLQQAYTIFDSAIIGNYVGKEALASVESTVIISNFLIYFFTGVGGGASVSASHYFGASKYERLTSTINTSIIFSLVVGILTVVFGYYIAPIALSFINVPEELMSDAVLYLRIYLFSAPLLILYNILSGISRSLGDSKSPTLYLGATAAVNIILDFIFVVILNKGVFGAAVATSLSIVVSGVLMLKKIRCSIYYRKHEEIFSFTEFKIILKLGIPMGLESSLFSISNLFIRQSLNILGTDVIAAHGIYMKVNFFPNNLLNAMGISLTTFVGQNFGAKKIKRVTDGVKKGFIITIPIIIIVNLIEILFVDDFVALFLSENDPNVIAIAHRINFYFAYFYATFIPSRLLSASIRGTGNSLVPMIITLAGTGILRIIYLFAYANNHLSIDSIFFIYPFSWAVTSVVFIGYYLYYKRKIHLK